MSTLWIYKIALAGALLTVVIQGVVIHDKNQQIVTEAAKRIVAADDEYNQMIQQARKYQRQDQFMPSDSLAKALHDYKTK